MTRQSPREQYTSQAKDYVAAPKGEKLASEHDMGELPQRTMKSSGAAKDSLEDSVIERVGDIPFDTEHMQMLAFMAEPVTVRMAETSDPNADDVFEIIVNGRIELFKRGQTKTVPRYYVDRLMRMRVTRIVQSEAKSASGEMCYLHTPVSSLKYDFSIERDTNPVGKDWQRAVMAEPS